MNNNTIITSDDDIDLDYVFYDRQVSIMATTTNFIATFSDNKFKKHYHLVHEDNEINLSESRIDTIEFVKVLIKQFADLFYSNFIFNNHNNLYPNNIYKIFIHEYNRARCRFIYTIKKIYKDIEMGHNVILTSEICHRLLINMGYIRHTIKAFLYQ